MAEIPKTFPIQKTAFIYGDENKHTFYFSYDKGDVANKGSKIFGSAINIDAFFKFYETEPVLDRNYYELIRTDAPRCEYYDIDL